MFFNFAEERERRRRWGQHKQNQEQRDEGSGGGGATDVSARRYSFRDEHGRRGGKQQQQRNRSEDGGEHRRGRPKRDSWTSLPPRLLADHQVFLSRSSTKTSEKGGGGRSSAGNSSSNNRGSAMSRPELWPPSHFELMAAASPPSASNAAPAAIIPGWYRGRLAGSSSPGPSAGSKPHLKRSKSSPREQERQQQQQKLQQRPAATAGPGTHSDAAGGAQAGGWASDGVGGAPAAVPGRRREHSKQNLGGEVIRGKIKIHGDIAIQKRHEERLPEEEAVSLPATRQQQGEGRKKKKDSSKEKRRRASVERVVDSASVASGGGGGGDGGRASGSVGTRSQRERQQQGEVRSKKKDSSKGKRRRASVERVADSASVASGGGGGGGRASGSVGARGQRESPAGTIGVGFGSSGSGGGGGGPFRVSRSILGGSAWRREGAGVDNLSSASSIRSSFFNLGSGRSRSIFSTGSKGGNRGKVAPGRSFGASGQSSSDNGRSEHSSGSSSDTISSNSSSSSSSSGTSSPVSTSSGIGKIHARSAGDGLLHRASAGEDDGEHGDRDGVESSFSGSGWTEDIVARESSLGGYGSHGHHNSFDGGRPFVDHHKHPLSPPRRPRDPRHSRSTSFGGTRTRMHDAIARRTMWGTSPVSQTTSGASQQRRPVTPRALSYASTNDGGGVQNVVVHADRASIRSFGGKDSSVDVAASPAKRPRVGSGSNGGDIRREGSGGQFFASRRLSRGQKSPAAAEVAGDDGSLTTDHYDDDDGDDSSASTRPVRRSSTTPRAVAPGAVAHVPLPPLHPAANAHATASGVERGHASAVQPQQHRRSATAGAMTRAAGGATAVESALAAVPPASSIASTRERPDSLAKGSPPLVPRAGPTDTATQWTTASRSATPARATETGTPASKRRGSTGSITGEDRLFSRAASFSTPKLRDGLGSSKKWYMGIGGNDTGTKKVGPRSSSREQGGADIVAPVSGTPGTADRGSPAPGSAIRGPTSGVSHTRKIGGSNGSSSGSGSGNTVCDSNALAAKPGECGSARRVPKVDARGASVGQEGHQRLQQSPRAARERLVAASTSADGGGSLEIVRGAERGLTVAGAGAGRQPVPELSAKAMGVVAWRGPLRQKPSRWERAIFAATDPSKAYFRAHLALWLAATILLAADRLLWNVWPRQDVLPSVGGSCGDAGRGGAGNDELARGTGCGEDFFCAMDEAPGCLMDGSASVKAFDFIVRVTGRVIISTTNLILVTSCSGTWRYLSSLSPSQQQHQQQQQQQQAKKRPTEEEISPRGPRGCWRAAAESVSRWWGACAQFWCASEVERQNARLRTVGMWTMVFAVCLHVYAIFLPSLMDDGAGAGYQNEFFYGSVGVAGVEWPAQLVAAESSSDSSSSSSDDANRIDIETRTVQFLPDDLVGVVWLSAVLVLSVLLLAAQRFFSSSSPTFASLFSLRGEDCCRFRCHQKRTAASGGSWGRSIVRSADDGGGAAADGLFARCWWWLRAVAITAVVVESFRRRSHPHVWFINGPVLLWYTADRFSSWRLKGRSSRQRSVDVTRVPLDPCHDLLLWNSSYEDRRRSRNTEKGSGKGAANVHENIPGDHPKDRQGKRSLNENQSRTGNENGEDRNESGNGELVGIPSLSVSSTESPRQEPYGAETGSAGIGVVTLLRLLALSAEERKRQGRSSDDGDHLGGNGNRDGDDGKAKSVDGVMVVEVVAFSTSPSLMLDMPDDVTQAAKEAKAARAISNTAVASSRSTRSSYPGRTAKRSRNRSSSVTTMVGRAGGVGDENAANAPTEMAPSSVHQPHEGNRNEKVSHNRKRSSSLPGRRTLGGGSASVVGAGGGDVRGRDRGDHGEAILRLRSPPTIPRVQRPADGGRQNGRGIAGVGTGSPTLGPTTVAPQTFFSKHSATQSSGSGAGHDASAFGSFDACTEDSRAGPGSYCSTVDELFSGGARGQRTLATEVDGGWYTSTCGDRGPGDVDDRTFKRVPRRGRFASAGSAATSDSREEVDILFRGGDGWSGGSAGRVRSAGARDRGGSGDAGGGVDAAPAAAAAAAAAASSDARARARSTAAAATAAISVVVPRHPPNHVAALSSPSSLSDVSLPSLLSMSSSVDDPCSVVLTSSGSDHEHDKGHTVQQLRGAARRDRSGWNAGGAFDRGRSRSRSRSRNRNVNGSWSGSDGRGSAFTADTYATMTTAATMTTNTNTNTTARNNHYKHNSGSSRSIVRALTSASSSSFSVRSRSFRRSPLCSPVPIRFGTADGSGGVGSDDDYHSGREGQAPLGVPCSLVESAVAMARESAEGGKGSPGEEGAAVPAWDTMAIVRTRAVEGGRCGSADRSEKKPQHSAAGEVSDDDLEAGRATSSAQGASLAHTASPSRFPGSEKRFPYGNNNSIASDRDANRNLSSNNTDGNGDGGEAAAPRQGAEIGIAGRALAATVEAVVEHDTRQCFRLTPLYGLTAYPNLPPILVVGTGACGAGLVLAFMAHAAAAAAGGEAEPTERQRWPVSAAATVAYACDSPALLRLVTNELLARKTSHDGGGKGARASRADVSVVTGLFRASSSSSACAEAKKEEEKEEEEEKGHKEMKVEKQQQQEQVEGADRRLKSVGSKTSPDSLLHGRLNLQGFIDRASEDTRVYYCGERKFERPLRAACARKCVRFIGVSVDELA